MMTNHPKTAKLLKLRPVFFQIGLLLAMGLVLGAFKWTTYGEYAIIEKQEVDTTNSHIYMTDIDIIDEYKKEVAKKEKMEKQAKPDPDKINLVDNTTEVDTNQGKEKYLVDLDALLNGQPFNPFDRKPDVDAPDTSITDIPDKKPRFPGGEEARVRFILNNLIMPYDVRENGQTVMVFVHMIVEKNGELTNIKVLKDGGFPSAGEEAVRVIKQMPLWEPGYNNIWPVRTRVVLPFKMVVR